MSDALTRKFGENLRRARNRSGLSQEEVGKLACLHRTEIGMLERGIRLPKIDTLIKLSAALDVTPAKLLEGMSWQKGDALPGRFETAGAQ